MEPPTELQGPGKVHRRSDQKMTIVEWKPRGLEGPPSEAVVRPRASGTGIKEGPPYPEPFVGSE